MTTANRKTNSSEIVASMRDVTVTFDGYLTRALSHVNLEVRRGEIFAILGARGAGKSTMAKIFAGRVRVTEGAVKVFGRSPRRGSSKARVGYVPAKAEANAPRGFFSRLFGRKRETPDTGRGGVNLTQAIMGGRDLVVLDEPFAELAQAEKAELKTLLRELAQRGKTVIVTGESLTDTKDVCDRLAVLHEGRIQAIGRLEEMLGAPGAIRLLAPVLPVEVVGRIAKLLRDEIVGNSELKPVAAAGSEGCRPLVPDARETGESAHVSRAEEQLAALTKGNEGSPASELKPEADSSIDHEKLEGLTRPASPE